LLISHRPAGLERMDEILIMEHGRVAERGMHSDLLAHSPRYRAMFDVIPAELVPLP
jgi:ABC-type multidrug transport system fused ATPase/permease subunit